MSKPDETKELVVHTGNSGFNDVVALLQQRPDINPETIHRLIDANERILDRQAEIDFNEAMGRLQPKLPVIEKTTQASKHKYAKHEHLEVQIRHLYTEEGFAPTYTAEDGKDGFQTFYGTLSHKSGHSRVHKITLPMDEVNASKNKVQASVATFTYAQRVLLKMMFNLVIKDEDEDGELYKFSDIDEAQFNEIMRLIDESKTDTQKFCKHLKIDSVKEMPQKMYAKAVQDLKGKIKVVESIKAKGEKASNG